MVGNKPLGGNLRARAASLVQKYFVEEKRPTECTRKPLRSAAKMIFTDQAHKIHAQSRQEFSIR